MKRALTIVALVSAAALTGAQAQAQTGGACDKAMDGYNSALSGVAASMRKYATCVADSRGQSDCASEFKLLRAAQGGFRSAVTSYERACRD